MSMDIAPVSSPPSSTLYRGTLQGPTGCIEMLRVDVNDGFEWAVVQLDNTNLLTIHSTHGEWSQKWYSIDGTSFVAWILDRPNDYMMRKLNYGRSMCFQIDKTVDAIKRHIMHLRRKRKIASVDARDMWDEAESIDNEHEFWQYHESDLPGRDCEDCLVMEYPQGLQNFMAEQWPLVRQCLQTVVAEFGK
jgi:hypothetical protein